MPATPEAEASFAAFLAKVPDAPSSAHARPDGEEADGDAAAPLATSPETPADTEKTGAAEAAASPRRERKPKSADPASAVTPALEPDLAAVRAALKAGDLDTLGELLGEDPALYDERTPKWAARQRKEAKLTAERDRVVRQAETVVERWSPVSKLVSERETNPAALFELVEMLTGQDPDQAWTAALRARGTVDPRVPALTKAVTERDTRLAELEAERAARADAAFYETLRDEVDAKDVVRRIDGWEAKVATVLRESVDPDLGEPKLSVKQAAARVVRREREEYERRAVVFGEAPAPRKPRERAPERAAGPAGAKIRKLTRDEWLAARQNG